MAFTFLAAQGLGVGASLLQEDQIETCKNLLAENGDKIVLPTDVVIADAFSADAAVQIVGADGILDGWLGLDIGPESAARFAEVAAASATVFWNGPMGVFELAPFADGTRAVAEAISASPSFSVVGGGDSAAAVRILGVDESGFTHISTGGGASLEYLEGKELPGLAVLEDMMTMARKPLIAGNWKMNLNHLEGIALVQKISFTLPEKYYKHVEVAVIPPFTALRSVQTLIEADKLEHRLTARRICRPHDSGAYTGEISGAQLAKLGCTYVLVGHSERREYHNESDELLAKKVNAAYKHGLIPLLCVGEGLEVREAGNQVQHSVDQLLAAMVDVTPEQAATIVLAYEPVWAIGTGRVATPADAQEVCGALRAALAEKYGAGDRRRASGSCTAVR